ALNATTPPELSTLSLHDALPILIIGACEIDFTHHPPRGVQVAVAQTSGTEEDVYDIVERASGTRFDKPLPVVEDARTSRTRSKRSEEHTSELQSRENLVCRLLLE